MLQAGDDIDLAQEPLGTQRGLELRVQKLDRNLAVVLEAGQEYRGPLARKPAR